MSNHRWDKEQWVLLLGVKNDSKLFYNELESKHSENICQLDVGYIYMTQNIFNFLLYCDLPSSLEQA